MPYRDYKHSFQKELYSLKKENEKLKTRLDTRSRKSRVYVYKALKNFWNEYDAPIAAFTLAVGIVVVFIYGFIELKVMVMEDRAERIEACTRVANIHGCAPMSEVSERRMMGDIDYTTSCYCADYDSNLITYQIYYK